MKLSSKLKNLPRGGRMGVVLKKIFQPVIKFIRRFILSVKLMPKLERLLALILFIVALVLSGIKANQGYIACTNSVPADGGKYTEAVVGELKYLNPVYVQSDADKAASHLIFNGLVKIDKNQILPDLADRWEISANGVTYTFYLKKNVLFHDGSNLTANDIVYTLNQIKQDTNEDTRSPLFSAWKDVTVTVVDDYTISFSLPKPYGPFIFNCDFGVIPSYLSIDEFQKKFIGTGQYKYESTRVVDNKIVELKLKANEDYFGEKAKIASLDFIYFNKDADAVEAFKNGKSDALFGTEANRDDTLDLIYNSGRQLGLIFNLRNDKFKDVEFRKKVLTGGTFSEPTKIRLVALNAPAQKLKAEELKNRFSRQNIQLEIIYLNVIQLKDVLSSKEFELLLYGFDFSKDRDPYPFWHSSQLNQNNFAGYSDKSSDILLEDARMLQDGTSRNAKYDQFFNTLMTQYVAEFYDPIKFSFYVSKTIKGTTPITGVAPSSRYFSIENWYIKEKRVKK
jgi:ABC-type transport system substrate-binding protein